MSAWGAGPGRCSVNLLQTVATNTVSLLVAQAFNRFSGFLVAILLTRYLGTSGFGEYAFVCAYVGFFILITDMGVDIHIIREASCDLKASEDRAGNAIVLKAFLSLLAFAAANLVAVLIGIRGNRLLLIAISSSGMLLAPFTLYGAAFSATLKLHYSAIFDALGRAVLIGFVLAVVLLRGSLTEIFVALVLPGGFVALLIVVFARRLFRPRLALQGSVLWSILGKSFPIALGLFFTQILMRIDQVMLEALRGDHELGLYSVGVKCCEALNILPAIVTASLFPLLAKTAREGEGGFSRIYSLGFRYLYLALFPLVMILFLYPGRILSLLFGDPFGPGGSALRILCWSAPLFAMAHVCASVLISLDRRRMMFLLALVPAVLNIVLNALLIPRQDVLGGGNGAALATLLSLAACPPMLLIDRSLRPLARSFLGNSVKPALSVLPGMVCVFVFRMPLVAGIFCSILLYAVAAIALKAVDRSDLDRARRIFRREEEAAEAVSLEGRGESGKAL